MEAGDVVDGNGSGRRRRQTAGGDGDETIFDEMISLGNLSELSRKSTFVADLMECCRNSFEALNVENPVIEKVVTGNKATTSEMLEGKLMLVDDDGKPLEKLVRTMEETLVDDDYDLYDDDVYEGHDISENLQTICDDWISSAGGSGGKVELINNLDGGNPLFLQSNDSSSVSIVNFKLVVLRIIKCRSLSQELYVGQVCSEIAFEVWTELKKTYDKIDGFVVFDLMHKINNLKQGRTACTCDVKSGNAKHTQLIRLMQFSMGLNEVCQPIRSIILAKDPLPNVKDAFNIYSRKESHRGLHPSVSGGVKA
ncbi:hypothetical protein Tco_0404420 [Tanacetum coccineum]